MNINGSVEYSEYLKKYFDSHFAYLEAMLVFVEGTSEKARLQSTIATLKQELNQLRENYLDNLSRQHSNDEQEVRKFIQSCQEVIRKHSLVLQTNENYWFRVMPEIRVFLGALVSIVVWPLRLNSCFNLKFKNTFFSDPQKMYAYSFDFLSKEMGLIRNLSCCYQIAYDKPDDPMIKIADEEWGYATKILRPNGLPVEDGMVLQADEHTELNHTFIMMNGTIYAEGRIVNDTYKNIKSYKDEFGALWVVKEFNVDKNPYNDGRQNQIEREANISETLGFSLPLARSESVDNVRYFLISIFLPGQTLADYLKTCISNDEKIDLCIKILHELKQFHAKGYKHGDLHAGNIIINHSRRVSLIDFGKAVTNSSKLHDDLIDINKYVLQGIFKNSYPELATKLNSKVNSKGSDALQPEALVEILANHKQSPDIGEALKPMA